MSERRKPHNGRDRDGRFRVRQEDVDALLEDPQGGDYLRDDVRLGGAVADTGSRAGQRAEQLGEQIDRNRYEVRRALYPPRTNVVRRRPPRRHRGNH